MFLNAPDAAAKNGIKLGGSEINDEASWNGVWFTLTTTLQNGEVVVKVPASSAVIVKLSGN